MAKYTDEEIREQIDLRFSDLDQESRDFLYDVLSAKADRDGNITIKTDNKYPIEYDQYGNRVYGSRGTGYSRYGRRRLEEKATGFEKTVGVASAIKYTAKALIDAGKKLTESWRKMDDAASKFARSVGMSGAARRHFTRQTLQRNDALQLAARFNISGEEMAQLKSGLMGKTGRRVSITETGEETLAALNSLVGTQATQELISKLDAFGVGMADAGKIAEEMFSEASEKGIDFESYSKNFLDNIEMAQTYNFRNGVEGVKSMAKKATELQFSMKSAASFADKVGNLQGAIEAGAQLQSLGGTFMQFSNPLSMLSESLTDTEGLFDRMVNMFAGLGTFDKQTGQVRINSVDKRRARAASEAIGVSYEDMMKGITNTERRKEMARALDMSGNFLDKDTREMLLNIGTFQDGKAGYVDKEGKFQELSKINSDNLEEIKALNRTDSQNLADMAMNLRSVNEIASGMKKQKEITQALIVEEKVAENLSEIIKDISESKWLIKTWAYASMAYYVAQSGLKIGSIGSNLFSLFKEGKNLPTLITKAISGFKSGKGLSGKLSNAKAAGSAYMKNTAYVTPTTTILGNTDSSVGTMPGTGRTVIAGGGTTGGGDTASSTKGVSSKYGKAASSGAAKIGGIVTIADTGYHIYKAAKANAEYGRYSKEARHANTTAVGKTAGAVVGAVAGAFIPVIGPWLGSTIGSAIGSGFSLATKSISDANRKRKREELGIYKDIMGDYNGRELKKLDEILEDGKITNKELNSLNKSTQDKLKLSGDYERYREIESTNDFYGTSGFANGGIGFVGGNSYHGDNIVVRANSGEMFLSKGEQKNLFDIIKSGPIQHIAPIEQTPSKIVSTDNSTANQDTKVSFSPIKLDINGNLKVSDGKTNLNITNDLMRDKKFTDGLVDIILKSINIKDNVRYNVDNR